MTGTIRVEIIVAWPHRRERRMVELPAPARVEDAVAAFGPGAGEIAGIAVFGQRVKPGHALADGDRVELLRGLVADPKAARRARAEVQRNAARNPRPAG